MPSNEIISRRIKVKELMESGSTNKEIAVTLGISTSTVTSDKKAIAAHPDEYTVANADNKNDAKKPAPVEKNRDTDDKPEASASEEEKGKEEQPVDTSKQQGLEDTVSSVQADIDRTVSETEKEVSGKLDEIRESTRAALGINDIKPPTSEEHVIPNKQDKPVKPAPVSVPDNNDEVNDDIVSRLLDDTADEQKRFDEMLSSEKWDYVNNERRSAFIKGIITGAGVIAIVSIILNLLF